MARLVADLPRFLLGTVLLAYWGRVLRMAFKARRRTGRAANLWPGERVGRILRIVWAPIVVVWIAQPFVVAFCRHVPRLLAPVVHATWLAWVGAAAAMACLLLSRICWKAMGREWRMGIDPREHNPLIVTGPFAVVRHPIYALSAVMMIASIAVVPTPLLLLCGTAHIMLLWWESRREEQHLLRLHGQRYVRYRQRVGALIPTPWLRRGSGLDADAPEALR